MSEAFDIPLAKLMTHAVARGNLQLLADCLAAAGVDDCQEAMEAAVHWGDVACVVLLAPVCDIHAALAHADERCIGQPPGLQTTDAVRSALLAELMRRDARHLPARETERTRL